MSYFVVVKWSQAGDKLVDCFPGWKFHDGPPYETHYPENS